MKNEVIIQASEAGYFRAKKKERKAEIVESLAESLEIRKEDISDFLSEETEKRKADYRKRQAARLAKQQKAESKPVTAGYHEKDIPRVEGTRFLITCAQNNTDINKPFFDTLLQYCEHNKGTKLLIGKTLYNKNAFAQPQDVEDVFFDPAVLPYLVEGMVGLSNTCMFFAGANVLPTAKNPLSGFESVTGPNVDCIIPSVQISLKVLARLKHAQGKRLFSTGAVTLKNFIQRRAGQAAESWFNSGALIVEIDNHGKANITQIEAMDETGAFYDRGILYSVDGIEADHYPEVLQFGDIHAEKALPQNIEFACSVLREYQPDNLCIHDLLDFTSRNHHRTKDSRFIYSQDKEGHSVIQDINKVNDVLERLQDASKETTIRVIESNHDLAFARYLVEGDYRHDSTNALIFLAAQLESYKQAHNPDFNLLEWSCSFEDSSITDLQGNAIKPLIFCHPIFHRTDESVEIAGVEHGIHGHHGVNGSRATPAQLRGLGIRINSGHTHSPGIYGGVYVAGVLGSLDMGYNQGPSSWAYAYVLTWANGQRQIIFH